MGLVEAPVRARRLPRVDIERELHAVAANWEWSAGPRRSVQLVDDTGHDTGDPMLVSPWAAVMVARAAEKAGWHTRTGSGLTEDGCE